MQGQWVIYIGIGTVENHGNTEAVLSSLSSDYSVAVFSGRVLPFLQLPCFAIFLRVFSEIVKIKKCCSFIRNCCKIVANKNGQMINQITK